MNLKHYLGLLRDFEPVRFLKTRGQRAHTRFYDWRLNIRTGFEKIQFLDEKNSDSRPYGPTDYLLLRTLIGPVKPRPSDVVFDIGCGMGRVLCVFARFPMKKCIGVELSPELAAIATENAQRLRGRKAPIEIHAIDATCADYSEGTIFWANNPFGASTLGSMLDQIEKSLIHFPRTIRVVYVNAFHEHVFRERPWLKCVDRKSPWWSNQIASYWTNCKYTS